MNSQDYRNLQEAYLNVYDSDLREQQEFESWITGLLDEGYDLSDYTCDEMYEIYNDILNIVEEQKPLPRLRMAGQTLKKLRRGFEGARTAINAGETKDTTGGQIAAQRSMKDVTQAQNMFNTLLGHSKEKAKAKETSNRAIGIVAREDPASAAVFRKYKKSSNINASYEPDLFDYIMEYLMIEGYANTNENALVIMANMSEEWRDSIVEVRGGGK